MQCRAHGCAQYRAFITKVLINTHTHLETTRKDLNENLKQRAQIMVSKQLLNEDRIFFPNVLGKNLPCSLLPNPLSWKAMP